MMANQNEVPQAQSAGVDALASFVSNSRSHLETLAPSDLVLLRLADGLLVRLQWALERKGSLSTAMLSPADVLAVNELADVVPVDRAVFAELGADLSRTLSGRKSPRQSMTSGAAAYPR
jgi:hypothetical protein